MKYEKPKDIGGKGGGRSLHQRRRKPSSGGEPKTTKWVQSGEREIKKTGIITTNRVEMTMGKETLGAGRRCSLTFHRRT